MNTSVLPEIAPFDHLAECYDEIFTNSPIGRAQREAVWRVADGVWRQGDHILEINCGTGEDARHFAGKGIAVKAYDSSPRMIEVARKQPHSLVEFAVLPTEELSTITENNFTGAFSNFSGLNCVRDLANVAATLARLLPPRRSALLCLSTRYCLSESIWYALRGEFSRAVRRWGGSSTVHIGDSTIEVLYWTVAQLRGAFEPWFALRRIRGIGIFVPPSYLNFAFEEGSRVLGALESLDRVASLTPLIRTIGDHILLDFERCAR